MLRRQLAGSWRYWPQELTFLCYEDVLVVSSSEGHLCRWRLFQRDSIVSIVDRINSSCLANSEVRAAHPAEDDLCEAWIGMIGWIDLVYTSDILWLCKLAPHFSTCLGEFQHRVPHPCHAVRSNTLRNEILFDEEGNYAGFDRNAPTSASGGKPKVLKLMKLGQRKQRAFRFTLFCGKPAWKS